MLRRSGFALARYVREVQEALVLGRVTSPALPAARAETIVLHRRGGKVSSLVLDEPREQLLEDLLAGAPVGRALERAFSRGASTGLDLGSSFAASTPAAWIEHWTSQGLFLHPGKRRW